LFAAVCLLVVVPAAVAEELAVLGEKIGDVTPKEMMHGHLMRLAGAALDRRDAEYEKIKTPQQIAAYQERMRQFYVDALGGFPERTPLEAQVTGKLDRDGYRIEKIIYQSQPKHYVTALLYLPKTDPPYPGVLLPCGHSGNGKAAYQQVSVLLAKNGLAVLCYDPIEQGERYQLLRADGKPQVGGTTAHSMVGIGSTLLGRNTATFRIWDGMRGIDYLQSRKEIDPQRIGCTGNSGGGTLTSYLMALDERIDCAAPSCYLCGFRRLLETIGPQDAEQNIHAQIAQGMDHADYVLMRAPKPTLICTATGDYFDIDGAWDLFRQSKRFYTRLGFAERVDLIETAARHGFSTQLRVGAVRWMRRWLLKIDDAVTEPDFRILSDREVLCSPRGQVMLIDGARSTYDINNDLEKQLAEVRKKFWQETDKAKALEEVRQVAGIRRLADLPQPSCEKTATIARKGYRIDKLIIKPEVDVWLAALAFVPDKPGGDAYLYLHSAGKQADAAPDGPIEKLVRQGHVVLAVDLRGLGETGQKKTSSRGIAHYVGAQWKDLYLAYMLDTSYLAMWAEDILVCGRLLAGYEATEGPSRVHLVSIGLVGPAAVHAAALEPQQFASLKLHNCLVSWSDVVHTPTAANQFANVVHGALKVYDLPDLLATLPEEKLTVTEPLNALGQPAGGQ